MRSRYLFDISIYEKTIEMLRIIKKDVGPNGIKAIDSVIVTVKFVAEPPREMATCV